MIDYYYSDPHFGHKNIIDFCGRPFGNVYNQTRELINRYYAVVGPNDLVLWLGDCFFCSVEEAQHIMQSLPGRKGLVMGNHDRKPRQMIEIGFEFVVEREMFVFLPGVDSRVKACHYPYANYRSPDSYSPDRYLDRRPRAERNEYLLHGHVHSTDRRQGNMLHVGVDAWDYRPVSAQALSDLINQVDKQ